MVWGGGKINKVLLQSRKKTHKEWEKIEIGEGKYKSGIDNILKTQIEFYKNLYTSEPIDNKAADEQLKNIDKEVTACDREKLDKDITKKEKRCEFQKGYNAPKKTVIIVQMNGVSGEKKLTNVICVSFALAFEKVQMGFLEGLLYKLIRF